MAQHDYVIANGTGAAVRSDLNNALAAIVSNNSGATEPATMYAYQWWADTSTGLLKLRNAANNAWITLRELDGTLTIEDGTASSPGLAFADDLNTGIYSPSADQLGITTGGTVRLTTTTTGITSALPVDVPLGTASAPTVTFTGDLNTGIYSPGADQVAISTNGAQRATIDSSGRVLVGTSSSRSAGSVTAQIQLEGTTFDSASLNLISNPGATAGGVAHITLAKSRSSTVGGTTVVASGDNLGRIQWAGADGTDLDSIAAEIKCEVDNTPGSNDMPGRLVLSTTADGASSPTERMRITSAGLVGIGTTSPSSVWTQTNQSTATIGAGIALFDSAGANKGQIGLAGAGTGADSSRLWLNGKTDVLLNIDGTEAARIDSSRRLLVGTSTSVGNTFAAASGNDTNLQIVGATYGSSSLQQIRHGGTTANAGPFIVLGRSRNASIGTPTVVAVDDSIGAVSFQGADGTNYVEGARIEARVDGTPGANDMPGRIVLSTTADGANSPTERMGIKNGGGISTFCSSSSDSLDLHTAATAGTSRHFILGSYGATDVTNGTYSFIVYSNGNVQNTNNSYGSISDLKLKENIVDATSQWDDLKALQVRKYNFKEGQTHTQIGLVAQEVELVSPGLVSESPDRDEEGNDLGTVTKSVNYSVLYMKAVKALQEAMERIEALEAKVATLEAA